MWMVSEEKTFAILWKENHKDHITDGQRARLKTTRAISPVHTLLCFSHRVTLMFPTSENMDRSTTELHMRTWRCEPLLCMAGWTPGETHHVNTSIVRIIFVCVRKTLLPTAVYKVNLLVLLCCALSHTFLHGTNQPLLQTQIIQQFLTEVINATH